VRCKLEISGGKIGPGADLQARTVAIIPGRRRMDFDFAGQFEPGDAAQVLAQDFLLDFELVRVGGLLVMASAAAGEMRAGRGDAMGRGLDNRFGVGAGESGLFLGERGFDFLSGENKGDEDGLAATARVGRKASESVAAVDELFNV